MLTPILFAISVSSSWIAFAGPLSLWLVRPLFVLPVLLFLFWIARLIPRHSIRRLFRRGTLTLALIYMISIFPVTVNVAEAVLKKTIPQDSGATADAIVILGRGMELNPSRAKVAAHLWQERRAPLIFISGVFDNYRLTAILHDLGIPDEALQSEGRSRTTYENAKFTADALLPQGIHRILLVTDSPHMLRSLLTFRGFGFEVTPVPSSSLKALDRTRRTRLVLREYLGLASYGLLGRFSEHEDTRVGAALSGSQEAISQKTTSQEIISQGSQGAVSQETVKPGMS